MNDPHTTARGGPTAPEDPVLAGDPLVRDLDALGRSLVAGASTPMPRALSEAIAERRQSRALFRVSGVLTAAAGVALVVVVVYRAGSPVPSPVDPRGTPGAVAGAPALIVAPLVSAPSSVASIRSAAGGLEGSALLDALPSSSSSASPELIPRAMEPLDSPRARAVLGRE